jgi:hypothetical protein
MMADEMKPQAVEDGGRSGRRKEIAPSARRAVQIVRALQVLGIRRRHVGQEVEAVARGLQALGDVAAIVRPFGGLHVERRQIRQHPIQSARHRRGRW